MKEIPEYKEDNAPVREVLESGLATLECVQSQLLKGTKFIRSIVLTEDSKEDSITRTLISNTDSEKLLLAHKNATAALAAGGTALGLLIHYVASPESEVKKELVPKLTDSARACIMRAAISCARFSEVVSAISCEAIEGTVQGVAMLGQLALLDRTKQNTHDDPQSRLEALELGESSGPQEQHQGGDLSGANAVHLDTAVPASHASVTFVTATDKILQTLLTFTQGKSLIKLSEKQMSTIHGLTGVEHEAAQIQKERIDTWVGRLSLIVPLVQKDVAASIRDYSLSQTPLLEALRSVFIAAQNARVELHALRDSGTFNISSVLRLVKSMDNAFFGLQQTLRTHSPVSEGTNTGVRRFLVTARLLWNAVKGTAKRA